MSMNVEDIKGFKKDDVKVPMGVDSKELPQNKPNMYPGQGNEKKSKYGASFACCDENGGNTDTALHRK